MYMILILLRMSFSQDSCRTIHAKETKKTISCHFKDPNCMSLWFILFYFLKESGLNSATSNRLDFYFTLSYISHVQRCVFSIFTQL